MGYLWFRNENVAVHRWRSSAYFTSSLLYFGTVGLYRSDMLCVFSAWFCPSTFSFARHQRDTLSSLSPETRDVAARDSGDKRVQSTEPDIVNGSILQLICARICVLASF